MNRLQEMKRRMAALKANHDRLRASREVLERELEECQRDGQILARVIEKLEAPTPVAEDKVN